MEPKQGAPLAYSVKEACRVTSLGRSRIYQMIRAGDITVRKVGRRTLIPADALRRLVDEAA